VEPTAGGAEMTVDGEAVTVNGCRQFEFAGGGVTGPLEMMTGGGGGGVTTGGGGDGKVTTGGGGGGGGAVTGFVEMMTGGGGVTTGGGGGVTGGTTVLPFCMMTVKLVLASMPSNRPAAVLPAHAITLRLEVPLTALG
jgi:hypothetical protein